MGTDHVELGEGTLYFDDTAVPFKEGIVERPVDLNDIENPGTYITKTANAFNEFTVTLDSCTLSWMFWFKVSGAWNHLKTTCPNRRVAHLMEYGKNDKIRRKNFRRACKMLSRAMTKEIRREENDTR